MASEALDSLGAGGSSRIEEWLAQIDGQPMPIRESSKSELAELQDGPGSSLADMNRIFGRDPMIVVSLLRKVNDLRRDTGRDPVTTCESAVNLLGRGQLQIVIQSLKTTNIGSSQPGRVYDYLRIVQRSVLSADLSEYFAQARGNLHPAEIRTAALLRALGEMAIAWHANASYRRLRLLEHRGAGCLNALAQQRLGFSVADLGSTLARQWRLPPTVLAAMDPTRHHEHRALAPMLADELTRQARNGWHSVAVHHCLEVIADYLGVSVGEASRQVHVVAVQNARDHVDPGLPAAAHELLFLPGRIPLPLDYPSIEPEPASRPQSAPPPAARAVQSPTPAPTTVSTQPAPAQPRPAPAPQSPAPAQRSPTVPGRAPPAPRPASAVAIPGASQSPSPATAVARSAPERPVIRPPQPAVFAKSIVRFRELQAGGSAKSSEIVRYLLRGLYIGMALPRVVVLILNPATKTLVLRFQVGPEPGWPKQWQISTSNRNLFERVLDKPQGMRIAADLIARHPVLLPAPLSEQVSKQGFWLAALPFGTRPWGLVYAEPRAELDTEESFRRFASVCNLASKTLAINAN